MEECGPFDIIVGARGRVVAVGARIAALMGVRPEVLVERPLHSWLRGAALTAPSNHSSALELRPMGRHPVAGVGVRTHDGSLQTITFVPEPAHPSRVRHPPGGDRRPHRFGLKVHDALTGIVGFAQLVPMAPTLHRRKYYVEQVISQADRVRRLVHAYESLLGAEATPFVRPADLGAALSRCLAPLRASLEGGGIGFDLELGDAPVWAACDIRQVCDLVTALILRATAHQRAEYQANEVVLRVRSGGNGARAIARVELSLTGAEDPRLLLREAFGTDGVGDSASLSELELRRGIVALERQSGQLTLEHDEAKEEVRITVSIPETRPPRMADRLRTPVPLDVLVVDDDSMIGALYQEMLQVAGHTVTASRTILGAREALRRQRFDVVVAEFQFKDGLLSELWAVASETHPELSSRLVIATRDPSDARLSEWAAQRGTPVLAKPFTAPVLLEQLALMI